MDAEPRLQRPVLFPIPQRCPDEHAADDHCGEEDEQEDNNDRSGNVHARKGTHRSDLQSDQGPRRCAKKDSLQTAALGALCVVLAAPVKAEDEPKLERPPAARAGLM